MSLQEIRNRLIGIQEIHTRGEIPPCPGQAIAPRQNDPQQRAIAVVLGLGSLISDLDRAIHEAAASRS